TSPYNAGPLHQSMHEHLHIHSPVFEDVRTRTDYLVLDLGKISLANQFTLSEDRHPLVHSDQPAISSPQGLVSPRRRGRKSLAPSWRVPTEALQLRLEAMNLILASPGLRTDLSNSASTLGSSEGSSTSVSPLDDAGLFWASAVRKKVFEDVHVS